MKKLLIFLSGFSTFFFTLLAFAQEHAAGASTQTSHSAGAAIGAGIAIGIAAMGGALGQGRAAASALEGIARNPGAANKVQTPMILGLALMESLVILAWVIAPANWFIDAISSFQEN